MQLPPCPLTPPEASTLGAACRCPTWQSQLRTAFWPFRRNTWQVCDAVMDLVHQLNTEWPCQCHMKQKHYSGEPSPNSWLTKSWYIIKQTIEAVKCGVTFSWTVGNWDMQLQFSSVVSNSLWPHGLQHVRLPCPSPTPIVYSNSCPLSRWCHPTISSSLIPFSCLQSLPASGSFPVSQLFTSGGQSIWVSASASVFPMNIQDWFPLGWTGWISLQSKRLSTVFSNTTDEKHQFFGAQLSL